jgi:hypothetical protein
VALIDYAGRRLVMKPARLRARVCGAMRPGDVIDQLQH